MWTVLSLPPYSFSSLELHQTAIAITKINFTFETCSKRTTLAESFVFHCKSNQIHNVSTIKLKKKRFVFFPSDFLRADASTDQHSAGVCVCVCASQTCFSHLQNIVARVRYVLHTFGMHVLHVFLVYFTLARKHLRTPESVIFNLFKKDVISFQPQITLCAAIPSASGWAAADDDDDNRSRSIKNQKRCNNKNTQIFAEHSK